MKKINLIVIIIIVLAAGYYGYTVFNKPTVEPVNNNQLIGGETDDHDCLIAAGYSWCETKQKCLRIWEEGCADNVFTIFSDLESTLGIDFTEQVSTDLKWIVEDEGGTKDLTLTGYSIQTTNLTPEQTQSIKDYFTNNGFSLDQYNVSAGTTSNLIGVYHKGFSLACTITSVFSDFDPEPAGYVPQTTNQDVTVTCGLVNTLDLPIISAEKRIKQALAEKYDKKISEVQIEITEETENYAKGGVKFAPFDEGVGGGLFLATKINGTWELVFDGNGSVDCDHILSYGFPDSMMVGVCDL